MTVVGSLGWSLHRLDWLVSEFAQQGNGGYAGGYSEMGMSQMPLSLASRLLLAVYIIGDRWLVIDEGGKE